MMKYNTLEFVHLINLKIFQNKKKTVHCISATVIGESKIFSGALQWSCPNLDNFPNH